MDLSFTLSELIGYVAILLGLGGAWADLRPRSLSNSEQIKRMDEKLEDEIKEVHERIKKAEFRVMTVNAKIETQREQFSDYRERAAQTFVTHDKLESVKRDIIDELRRLGDRFDNSRDKIPPAE